MLQQLIMQKAAEDLKRQQEKEAAEKKEYLEKIIPKLEVDGLNDGTTPLPHAFPVNCL